MTETLTPIEDFLMYLSYFGTHLDNPILNEVMTNFGLMDRDALTDEEMGAVLNALGERLSEELGKLEDPAAASYARLMNLASGVVNVVAVPE